MNSSARDQIYSTPLADIGGFRFDQQVVDVFPLGATLLSMRHAIANVNCELVGVDNSTAMIKRCKELLDIDNKATRAERQSDSSEQSPPPVTLIQPVSRI